MATNIKLKKSAIAGKVPLSADLEYGEVAINYADGILYFKNTSNSVQSIGASPLGVDSAPTVDLIEQTINTNYIATIVDSQYVLARVDIFDSSDTINLINSAYIQARQDYSYSSLTGTPNILDSADVALIAGSISGLDSNGVRSLVDSAYIQTRQADIFRDSAFVTNIIDTAYIQARDRIRDSNFVQDIVDSSYVQLRQTAQDFAYSSLTGAPNVLDSADVALIAQANDTTRDSAFVTNIIDSAYIQLRDTPQDFAYSSLTGAPTTVSSFTNDANYLDSTTVQGVVDATYIQSNQTTYNTSNFADSAFVTAQINALIDGAPGTLDTLNEIAAALNDDDSAYTTLVNLINAKSDLDSADALALINAAYIQSNQITYNTSDFADSAFVTSQINAISIPTLGNDYIDSAQAIAIIDSAHVQLRQTPQDFSYSSLTGAPNVLDSSNIASIISSYGYSSYDSASTLSLIDSAYIQARQVDLQRDSAFVTGIVDSAYIQARQSASAGGGGTDSATVVSLIGSTVDSAYVQARQSIVAAGATTITAYDYIADSGDTDISGADIDGNTLSYTAGQIQVFVNGILLVDSNDYIATNGTSVVLGEALDSDDVVSVIAYKTTAVGTLDSASIINLIDSAYIQARQDFAYSSLTGAPTTLSSFTNDTNYLDSTTVLGVIDATYIQSNQTAQDFAYSSLTGAPNILDSSDVALIAQANDTTRDSSFVSDIIDSAYINARVSATDSATVSSIITQDVDAAFINALTIDADTLGGQNSAYHLDYNNFTNTPTIPTAVSDLTNDTGFTTFDSTNATGLITSYGYSTYDSDNFTGQLAAASTTDLSEGTNLYYTTARHDSDFDARLSAGTGVTVSSGQVSIGQAVGTTDSVEFNAITTTGNVIIGGNLQVTGTTTTVNSEDLNVTDHMIYMNAGESAGSPTASIDVGWAANVNDNGSYTHVGMFRDATDDTFKVFGTYTPEPDVAAEINTGHASFTLAPFAASTLTGQYQGFDSDVTAAGLATQTYVDNAVAALPDSAQVATIVTSYGYTTFDSTNATGLITSYGYTTYDSTDTLGLIDSAYIQARQVDLQRDSAFITEIVDSNYIQAKQDFAYSSLTGAPTNVSTFTNDAGYTTYDSDNFTGQLTNLVLRELIDDSSLTIDGDGSTGGVTVEDGGITIRTGTGNVAYADFYCEVTNAHRTRVKSAAHADYSGNVDVTLPTSTGTLALTSDIPTAVSSLTNDANYLDSTTVLGVIDATYIQSNQTTYDFLDSAEVINLIDSAYVQARQTAGGSGTLDSATVAQIIGEPVLYDSSITYSVTVDVKSTSHRYYNDGSSNAFYIDSVEAPYIKFTPGQTYTFDQSDTTNTNHPLRFYYDVDKTTSYTDGVTSSGTPGSSGAKTVIVVNDDTPARLYYQCQFHDKMGWATSAITHNLTGLNTDDLTEGSTNRYFSNSLARGAISNGTGVSYSSSTGVISIGQPVGTSDNVTFSNVVVSGNLTVSGSQSIVNTETINLADNIITLNSNATGSASENAGIEIERGDDTNVALRWNETTDKWQVTEDGSNYYNILNSNDAIDSSVNAGFLNNQPGSYYLNYNNLSNTPTSILDFGISDGNSGQVLTTNGSGGFTFTTVSGAGGGGAAGETTTERFKSVSTGGVSFGTTGGTFSDVLVYLNGMLARDSDDYAFDDSSGIVTFVSSVETGTEVEIIGIKSNTLDIDSDNNLTISGNLTANNITSTGDVQVGNHTNINSSTTTLTADSEGTIDTFSLNTIRGAKYVITVENDSSRYQISELLCVHDSSTATVTTYGTINTGTGNLAVFDADIDSANGLVRILATPTTINTVYKMSRTDILI